MAFIVQSGIYKYVGALTSVSNDEPTWLCNFSTRLVHNCREYVKYMQNVILCFVLLYYFCQ